MIIQNDLCDKMFKVDQYCDCSVRITDTTHSLYDQESLYSFKYEDTMTLDIIIYNNSISPKLQAIVFTDHNGYLTEVKLPLSKDGWYTIYHIILPTDKWYYKEQQNRFNKLNKYKDIYITDGKSIYRRENGELVKLEILDLLREDLNKTTAHIYSKDIFSTCYLEECYISICNKLLSKDSDTQIEYQRDFIWSTLEIINILVQNTNLRQAQSIIEEVMNCKGFCFSNVENKSTSLNQISQYNTSRSNGFYIQSDCNCNKQ